MGKFAKQTLVLGSAKNSFQTDEGYSFSGDFDMDNIAGTLTFNLPYKDQHIKDLKKYDTCFLYFGYFDSDPGMIQVESGQKESNGLIRCFTGYINSIKLSKSKTDYNYSIEAVGTFAMCNEKQTTRKVAEVNTPISLVNTILQLAGMQNGQVAITEGIQVFTEVIPESTVLQYVDPQEYELYARIQGGTNAKEMMDDIRTRYGLILHQTGDGTVWIMTPLVLATNPKDVNAWEFKLGENMFEMDYGDLESDVNSVVVIGRPPVYGMAVDVAAVELRAGENPVQESDYRWITFENRDLISDEDCQKVARSKLLEIARNFFVSFKTLFDPRFEIGQMIKVWDYDRFDGRIFVIKKFTFTIDKGDVSAQVTGYAHSLQLLPEELVLSPSGINDLDALDITKEVNNIFAWGPEE